MEMFRVPPASKREKKLTCKAMSEEREMASERAEYVMRIATTRTRE